MKAKQSLITLTSNHITFITNHYIETENELRTMKHTLTALFVHFKVIQLFSSFY